MQVVDGQPLDEVRHHLEDCPNCRSFLSFAQGIPGWFSGTKAEESRPNPGPSDRTATDSDRYSLGEEFVRGGMGLIRKAWDQRLGRPVAVKELLSQRGSFDQRFWQEAWITARLQHPAVVPIYDAGRGADGKPFYVMKMVAGQSLEEMIADTRSLEDRLALLPKVIVVAEAVAYAHNEGVIHRDLKPANVLVGQFGETVVIDWGLAKHVAERAGGSDASVPGPRGPEGMTVAGSVLGTPAYMSPEQARGEPVDERSDVYALGALLYHLLAGRPPYRGNSREALTQVLAGPPATLEGLKPRPPTEILAITAKAMARSAADRYATAKELAEDLKRWQAGQLVSAYRYSAGARLRRWMRRHQPSVAVAIVAVLALALTAVLSVRRIVREKDLARRISWNLLVEQGRQELLAGRPERALVMLREVHRGGHRDPILGFLFARLGASLPLMTLRGDGLLTSAAFSPDGRNIAVASRNGTVLVFDAARGKRLFLLSGHRSDVVSVAYSPDGRHLLSASHDGTAVVWDVALRRRSATLAARDGALRSALYRRDGAQILTVGATSATIWDSGSGAVLGTLRGRSQELYAAAAYRPDGWRILTTSDDTARIWDVASGRPLLSLRHGGWRTFGAYNLDGSRVLIPARDYIGILWDAESGRPLTRLVGHQDLLTSGTFDAGGRRIVTSSEDESARIWNAVDGSLVATLRGHIKAVMSAAYSPDGTRIVTASHDGTAKIWDAGIESQRLSLEVRGADFSHGRFSPDGRRVVAAGSDGVARVIDLGTGGVARSLLHPQEVSFAAYTAGGRHVLTGSRDGAARLWDADSGDLLWVRSLGGKEVGILDHHGPSLRIVTGGPTVDTRVWDLAGGSILRVLRGVQSVAAGISPDGTRMVTADPDSAVRIWDLWTGAMVGALPTQQGILFQVLYSPDGTRIATGGWDETARIWDAQTGSLVSTLAGHTKGISSIAFSPDGALVATGSRDLSVKLWEVRSGSLLASFEDHPYDVLWVSYSPDGSKVLSAGRGGPDGGGMVKVWDAHFASPAEAEALVRREVPWRLVNGQLLPAPHGAQGP